MRGHHERGRRIAVARLEHERVSTRDRHREHPHGHHRGKVERGDAGDDAEWLADRVDIGAAGDGLRVSPLQQVGDTARELDHLLAAADLPERVRQHLAVLRADRRSQVVLAAFQRLAEREQDAHPVRAGCHAIRRTRDGRSAPRRRSPPHPRALRAPGPRPSTGRRHPPRETPARPTTCRRSSAAPCASQSPFASQPAGPRSGRLVEPAFTPLTQQGSHRENDDAAEQDHRREHVDLRWGCRARLAEDPNREGRGARTGHEVRDDEVVDRERERQKERGEDPRDDQGQRHPEERARGVRAQVHRRVFERPVETPESRLDGERDVAHAEHDVREHDRREAQLEADVEQDEVRLEEQREQRSTEHDLRCGQRQHEQEVDAVPTAEPVANERHRDERPEDRGDRRRDQRDLEAEDQCLHERLVRERVQPVLEGELLPDRVEAAGGLVEAERDDDEDRQEQVGEPEAGGHVDRGPSDPPRG